MMINDYAPAQFPNFFGKVVRRPIHFNPAHQDVGPNVNLDIDDSDGEYNVCSYQYATSSRPGFCTPAAIIYPENDNDIKLAIQYAAEVGISIAIRSGGHQFWGFSSTSGQNIQLDMSGYQWVNFDEESETVTCGVGTYLYQVDDELAKYDAFLPHGMCGTVAIGGHIHTGGFSVLCGRSYGFFDDFVLQFKIITADLSTRVITKPDPKNENPENDDIWFAVLGGSPGGFGVVTQVTLKPFFDRDYPNARSMTLYLPFSEEALENILQITADYSDKYDLPADYNVTCWTFGSSNMWLRKNIDTKMMKHHPEIYGGTPAPHPYVLAVWATYTNLDGGEYTKEAQQFFADIKRRVEESETLISRAEVKIMEQLMKISEVLDGSEAIPSISPDEPIAMSKLSKLLCFKDRVHSNPHVSASWCGDSFELGNNGFVQWARDITMEVYAVEGCYADFGWVMSGGKFSRYRDREDAHHCSIPWRDTSLFVLQYIHYDFTDHFGNQWDGPGDFARDWVQRVHKGAIGPGGCLASKDRQWNAFPNSFESDSLDERWPEFFDTEHDYRRVLQVKKTIDPLGVFTPNKFIVGAVDIYSTSE